MDRRLDPFIAALVRADLPGHASRPERNHITEADLFRGYSGLVDERPPADPLRETVRPRYSLAYGTAAGDGAGSRAPLPSRQDGTPDAATE